MRILVLGATGHIGRRLVGRLRDTPWAVPVAASRTSSADVYGSETVQLDVQNVAALTAALRGADAVVNAVAGGEQTIAAGMAALIQACKASGCRRIVHLSSMSVYGPVEGRLQEATPLNPDLGWYGRAKCEAEMQLTHFSRSGGEAVVLRPGCVFGPHSELWVGRIGRWLKAGRLGDLGIGGDGWSNLVHVDDVCSALMVALQMPVPAEELPTFNLSAPDSPRWNDYFVDLALALHATPVRRLAQRQLQIDAWLAGPPLKLAQTLLSGRHTKHPLVPDPMPPGLLRLWAQHIQLDSAAATQKLGLQWTSYEDGLKSSSDWFLAKHARTSKLKGSHYARIESRHLP